MLSAYPSPTTYAVIYLIDGHSEKAYIVIFFIIIAAAAAALYSLIFSSNVLSAFFFLFYGGPQMEISIDLLLSQNHVTTVRSSLRDICLGVKTIEIFQMKRIV